MHQNSTSASRGSRIGSRPDHTADDANATITASWTRGKRIKRNSNEQDTVAVPPPSPVQYRKN